MNTNPKICVAIPAFNEAPVIGEVIESLLIHGYQVIVVDDGSTDETYEVCRRYPVDLLRHPVNMGYGAAQQTGLQWAAQGGMDLAVTFDADGQHVATEIPKLIQPILDGRADVVIGSRFLGRRSENMPPGKRFVLKLAVWFTRLTTGLRLTDAHNGMRAFSREAVLRLKLTQSGMAYSSELLSWLARSGLRWTEVPIEVRYTPYSLKKGQSIWNLFNILWEILMG